MLCIFQMPLEYRLFNSLCSTDQNVVVLVLHSHWSSREGVICSQVPTHTYTISDIPSSGQRQLRFLNIPHENMLTSVRNIVESQGKLLIRLVGAVRHCYFELKQDARQDELDLVRGEKPAWACMLADSKTHVLFRRADVLVLLAGCVVERVGGVRVSAEVVKSVWVESLDCESLALAAGISR